MNFIFNHALKIVLGILFSVIVFHLCILLKIIPYQITWGGRLQNDTEMYIFETISILINIFLVWILLMKSDLIKFKFSTKVIQVILWIFCFIFTLNTIGNLFAKTNLEKQFSFLTAILALLIWVILRKKSRILQE
jgi:hypothetical protein